MTILRALLTAFLPLATLALLPSCQSTQPSPGAFQRLGEIKLDLSTGKPTYRVGELMTCSVTPAQDCQLTLIVQRADGKQRVIYPNGHSGPSRIFKAGKTVQIPAVSDSFDFRVVGPTGREQLIVRATSVAGPSVGSQVTMGSRPGSVPPVGSGTWLKDAQPEARGSGGFSTGDARVVYDVVP